MRATPRMPEMQSAEMPFAHMRRGIASGVQQRWQRDDSARQMRLVIGEMLADVEAQRITTVRMDARVGEHTAEAA